MLSRTLKVFCLLLPCLLSCHKAGKQELVVQETKIEGSWTGGEFTISLQASMPWDAHVRVSSGNGDWISFLSGSTGLETDKTMVVRLQENPGHDREATLTITVTGTFEFKQVHIWQEGYLDEDMTDELDPEVVTSWLRQNPRWGRITRNDLLTCKSLSLFDLSPSTTFQGMHLFPALKQLNLHRCHLADADFGEMPGLQSLSFHSCTLERLDLSGNTALSGLFFMDTSLKTLDVRQNAALRVVEFGFSSSYPDIEQVLLGPGTESFYADHASNLKVLDCSLADKLDFLSINNCGVQRLDLKKTRLTTLDFRWVALDELLLPPGLKTLSIDHCTGSLPRLDFGEAIQQIAISDTSIAELDFGNSTPTSLNCGYNQLTHLDFSHTSIPSSLTYFYFPGNPGKDGVFEIRVSPADFPSFQATYEGRDWKIDDRTIITHIVSCP